MPKKGRISLQARLELDKEDETLVWDLQETGAPRDERLSGAPCYGQHRVDQHNCRIRNQHALILKCRVCQVRLLYVPVRGSSGDTRKPTPLRCMHGGGSASHSSPSPEPPKGKGRGKGKTPPPSEESPPPAPKAKAKAKSRIRHTDGPDWQDFLIHTPEEETYSIPTEEEAETYEDDRPVWDGDPDTWETYQTMVNEYLQAQRTEASAPPAWDGDPDSWETYQAAAQEWVDDRRERGSMSTQGSQL